MPNVARTPGIVAVASRCWIQDFFSSAGRPSRADFKMHGDNRAWVEWTAKNATEPRNALRRIVQHLHIHIAERQIQGFPPVAMAVGGLSGKRGKELLIRRVTVNCKSKLAQVVFADGVFPVVLGATQSR